MQQDHNPFTGVNLAAPSDQRVYYDLYCQTQTPGQSNVNQSPFPRKVDFWFAGLSLAARKELKPVNLFKQQTDPIIDGSIFDSDSWRVHTVMLVAIAIEENVEIVSEPRRMMDIANGLAAAGVPHIVEMLQHDRNLDPIWNLSDSLNEILREK